MNKSRLLFLAGLGFFVVGVALTINTVITTLPLSAANKATSQFQAAVQTADEIEISTLGDVKLHPDAPRYRTKRFPETYAVTSTYTLGTAQTKEVLDLLRPLQFITTGGSLCHDPGYLMRFRREGREIFQASACFHCSNLETEPFASGAVWIFLIDADSENLDKIEGLLAMAKEISAREGKK